MDGFAITEKESREEGLSLFSDVLKRKAYNRAPVLNIKDNQPLIKILSGTPQDALLIPIKIRDKVIALLYIDNGTTLCSTPMWDISQSSPPWRESPVKSLS